MKRSLVSFEAFKKLEEHSATTAEFELIEAENLLAQALGVEGLQLYCFGESDATYKTINGTFVHASYTLNENKLTLENVQELVIDEGTEKEESKKILRDMLDSILEDNNEKATAQLHDYLELPAVKRAMLGEAAFKVSVSKPSGKHNKLWHKKQSRSLVSKRIREMLKTKKKNKNNTGLKNTLDRKRKVASTKLGGVKNPRWRVYVRKVKPKTMKEWAGLCENVIDYLNYAEFGPDLKSSEVAHDDKGNITAISLPTTKVRNEGKILSFDWKVMDHEVKVLRSDAKRLQENLDFCKSISELKRFSAISDDSALQTTLENIITKWPNVLYLTQGELSKIIGEALQVANVITYDDQICDFMAEGILRTAHNFYTDRVEKINTLSGTKVEENVEDTYASFKSGVEGFYSIMDENDKRELSMFNDLYDALKEMYSHAQEVGDSAIKDELEDYLSECESILNRESEVDLDLAESIVSLLSELLETNLNMSDWDLPTVHNTINGDHPDMANKAKQGYSPASDFSGDWGDVAPVSDGTPGYKNNGLAGNMRSNSWGNIGGEDTYPSLNNPHVPKPFGDYKMIGGEEGGEDLATTQGGDTWPNLSNPYIPKAIMPKMKGE
jgi:hypothetical protein